MAKAKKFGAFAGVYTPSLLTILGVIMYMRLGWVVGQAGLINAVIIILLAHVISVSTGLSVSSIATDKKIKAGGIYYILSRSLGLPMGGAIGITLFIGTALSISLYLVGFAENFLSIEVVRNVLGLEENRFGYQVVGTGAIIMLVLIAFISTSLAIKTQYYILGAIGLSLISIFAGLFMNTGFHPEHAITAPAAEGIPLEVLFAIFFPAVTGFTAGVAMSGDLKDPKRDIPLGTLSAIITGFVVYVVLAIGVAFFVNRDLLINDINYLMKVAWFSPLVIAGVWGATLSSALGGILGGPRILQAMSADHIGPRIFARGYGVNNEPRNALLLIFLIAEAGILIGELNVIAGIVSMFYLASYGFINIAYYLESWASADFRPSFRIKRYIGLVGFIAAFGVMFKLDMLSMFAALVIMTGIYFWLKRKQLKLDYGDVWQSVWSSLMRTALKKMDMADEVERNWQPNIILFSGGTKKRPHLMSLGKCLVGRHGILSNFDLIENKGVKALFPKKNQSVPGEVPDKGVFTRRQTVKDIYEGIDMISRTYGFSGLEPNTVMLGWARQTRDPNRFAELLRTLYGLDLNVLILGYDKRVGFGNKQTIDIWFKDRSNHGNLALTLTKLLVLSDEWMNAHVRVLIVNYLNEKSEAIYRKMEGILDNMRINAEVKVINNQIERKPFYDIVEQESATTSLVFLEIPRIRSGKEAEFVESTTDLLEKIGTVMLIEASSSFKKLKIGIEDQQVESNADNLQKTLEQAALPELLVPDKPELARELAMLSESLLELADEYFRRAYLPLLNARTEKTEILNQSIEKAFRVIGEKAGKLKHQERVQMINQLKTGLLVRITRMVDEQTKKTDEEKEDNLELGTEQFIMESRKIITRLPEKVLIRYYETDLDKTPDDPFAVRWFKTRKRIFSTKRAKVRGVPYPVRYRAHCQAELLPGIAETVETSLEAYGQYDITQVLELQRLMYAITDAFSYLENHAGTRTFRKITSDAGKNAREHIARLQKLNDDARENLPLSLMMTLKEATNQAGANMNRIPANHFITPVQGKTLGEKWKRLPGIPAAWAATHSTLLKSLHVESQLLVAEHRTRKTIRDALADIQGFIDGEVFKNIERTRIPLEEAGKGITKKATVPVLLTLTSNQLQLFLNKVIDKAFRNIKTILRQMPELAEVFTEETVNEITNHQFEDTETVKVPVSRLVDYYMQNELIAPMVAAAGQMVKETHDALTKIEDAARLITLSTQAGPVPEQGTGYEQVSDLNGFLLEQHERITRNSKRIEEEFEKFKRLTDGNLDKISRELHLYRLSRAADSNTLFSRKEAGKKLRFLRSTMDRAKANIQKLRANIWYSHSRARLLAKKMTEMDSAGVTVIDRILSLKESVTASPGNLDKLPFYYQQLFLSKYNYQSEFWFGRTNEIATARRAVKRYLAGQKGAIVITGDRISGKSFFANYLASESLKEHAIYSLSPSGEGSTDEEVFRKTLAEVLERSGTVDEMIDSLPEHSVLIIDDLELWWEKSENGHLLIQFIFHLIRKHSGKVLFILTANKIAYRSIRQMMPFEELALVNINLQPFSSRELQDIILFRHRTSGFNLSVDSILPVALSQARQARLFNRMFSFSGGNVGAALLGWIASIRDFKNDTIFMHSPGIPDIDVFGSLTGEMKVCLMQFLIHKRLGAEKLGRIMAEDEDRTGYLLDYLKRAGLITEMAGGVFEIDRYMLNHLSRFLLERYDKSDRQTTNNTP